MAELSDVGRKLIDAAMEHDEPPPVEDSWSTMVTRLSGAAPPLEMPSEPQPRPRRSLQIWGVIAGVAIVGLVVARLRHAPAEAEPRGTDTAVVATSEVSPAPAEDRRTPQPPSPARLLDEAEAALRAGDATRALVLLQQHAERAPTDPRAPERMGLRVLALCATGRRELARDEARALLAAHPRPAWGERFRGTCVDDMVK